jgi:hypothetical protein
VSEPLSLLAGLELTAFTTQNAFDWFDLRLSTRGDRECRTIFVLHTAAGAPCSQPVLEPALSGAEWTLSRIATPTLSPASPKCLWKLGGDASRQSLQSAGFHEHPMDALNSRARGFHLADPYDLSRSLDRHANVGSEPRSTAATSDSRCRHFQPRVATQIGAMFASYDLAIPQVLNPGA